MYLVFGYETPEPELTFRSGDYNIDNCGGPCQWYLTSKMPIFSEDYISVVVWGGEKYFFLLDFYSADGIDETPLYINISNRVPLIKLNETMYVALRNSILEGYNVVSREFSVNGEDNTDILGGMVLFGDLRPIWDTERLNTLCPDA
jgi:hypothetical protein